MIAKPELKIRQIRELKNITQEFVARELDISTRAYSKIENGETQLTINRLNEISEVLKVDPIEILGFDEKQIFTQCKQDGYIGINHISMPEKLVQQYEETIKALKEQIEMLKANQK
ncbi:MAG: transcriptional regulator [Polaribacter sp.]|nr:MAG: transcriptional regulator [Polaribacter sp.]